MLVMLEISVEYKADTPVVDDVVTEPNLYPLQIQLESL